MKIFFDTEFIEDGVTIDLISIGMVREDGKELHLINKECDWRRIYADKWLSKHVVPHLDRPGLPSWQSRRSIRNNILKFVEPEHTQLAGAVSIDDNGELMECCLGDNGLWYPRKLEFCAYFCVHPSTKILTSDLKWVDANTIKIGDNLIGFDEHTSSGNGRSGKWRKWKSSRVLSHNIVKKNCYKLTFNDGTEIICSEDHQWLTSSGRSSKWMKTKQLVCVNEKYSSNVIKPLDVWNYNNTRESGYLAGAFDGEGHLVQRNLTDKGSYSTKISFAQKENDMYDYVCKHLNKLNYIFNVHDYCGVKRITIGNRSDVFRFLGEVRPHRLLSKFNPDKMGSMSLRKVKLENKEFVGINDVVSMETTSKTFIANGLASHNCSYDWVALCQLFGKMIDLPENWPMYCRDFKQDVDNYNWKLKKIAPSKAHNALDGARWLKEEYERFAKDKKNA